MSAFVHDSQKARGNDRRATGSMLQRSRDPNLPASVHRVLAQEGRPLGGPLRAAYEPRFGHDFSKIRVHTDPLATSSAAELDAAAYTLGNHLVFGDRQFPPASPTQHHLLAHELAHAVQQASPSSAAQPLQSAAVDGQERAADAAANRFVAGEARVASGLRAGPVALMRQAVAAGAQAEPARLPLDAVVQATAYAFEADDDWKPKGSATVAVNFIAVTQQDRPAFFPPVQLPVEFGKRAIFEIVVAVNSQAVQASYWRCDATGTKDNIITRLDPLGVVPISTGGAADLVLGALQYGQNLAPNPFIQVTAPIAAPTTSITHTPPVYQPQAGLAGTSPPASGGAIGGATGGITINLTRVPSIDQTQRTPATPGFAVTFTADITVKNAPAAPQQAPSAAVDDLTYTVKFANDSAVITSPEINGLLGWVHDTVGKYPRLREAIRTGLVRVHITGKASTRGRDRAHNFTLSQKRVDEVRKALQGAASATGGGRTQGGALGGESVQIDPEADGDFHDPMPADIDQDRVVQIFISGGDATAALQKLAAPAAGRAP